MRIGIVAHLNPMAGGLHQYSLTMLHALHEETAGNGCEDEFVVFAREAPGAALTPLNGRQWTWVRMRVPLKHRGMDVLRTVVGEGLHREAWRWLRRRVETPRDAWPEPDLIRPRADATRRFRRYGVEMVLYASPNEMSFEAGTPYVMPIHDLQHRLQPEFPEVSANGEWHFREYLFRNAARHATLLLADSEVGKEDILDCYGSYGVTPDRIKVVPFLPACYLATVVSETERRRVRVKHDLPPRYLFYPAQFWLHKNHARIVQALGVLKRRYRQGLPIVLCGSHTGDHRECTFRETMMLVSQCGLERESRYLGYVPDGDMSGLYAEAEGLVMPTFFGPTNIPILEAWAFGCPVLTSDIRGIREQTGDGAILVDPRSVEAIADGIWRLWTDRDLARDLAHRGRQRLASYTPAEYRRRMIAVLEEAKARVAGQRAPVSPLNAELRA